MTAMTRFEEFSPTGATFPPTLSPPSPVIPSANGSTRTGMAATTCSKSRLATSKDHALTRPWTVTKTYKREQPEWREDVCAEGNAHLRIGKENYMLSADGYLMPAKKGQVPPDLKY